MPIKPENRALYPGGSPTSPEMKALRAETLARDKDRCRFCKAPNHQWICRKRDDPGVYMLTNGRMYDVEGKAVDRKDVHSEAFVWNSDKGGGMVQVILTMMHLDHDPGNNDPENRAMGCQRCHNIYDAPHRKKNAAETRRARRAARDLFEAAK